VDLDVEDEERRARPLLERGGLGGLHGQHVEEAAEDGVHGEERRRHPPARPEEAPAAEAQAWRQSCRVGQDARLDLALRGRLRQRREFLVGHEPRRQRSFGEKPAAHAGGDFEGVAILGVHGRLLR
jgi:hypothetical protein